MMPEVICEPSSQHHEKGDDEKALSGLDHAANPYAISLSSTTLTISQYRACEEQRACWQAEWNLIVAQFEFFRLTRMLLTTSDPGFSLSPWFGCSVPCQLW